MLTFTGTVVSVTTFPARIDKETGEQIDARHVVQLLGKKPGPDGQLMSELEDIKVEDATKFVPLKGKLIRLFVRPWFYNGKGGISAAKGFDPQEVKGDA